MTPVSLQMLGSFDVRISGRSIPLAHDAQRLVAFLALRRRPQTQTEMIRALWPCRTSSRGLRDLGALVASLPDAVRRGLLIDDDERCSLDDGWTIDLDAALEASRRLHEDPRPRGSDLSLFRLALLPEWSDEWLVDLQERYRRLRLSVMQRMGAHLLETHHTRSATEVARAMVAEDPIREDAQHLLIAALAQSGRHDLAHQQFVQFRARLRHEWGVAPSPQLHELVSRVHHPAGVAVS